MKVGEETRNIEKTIRQLYALGHTDYYFPPIVAIDDNGKPVGRIDDGDSVIFCCRRGEREIQLMRAFVDPGFNEMPVRKHKQLTFVPLTLYHESFSRLPVAFPPIRIDDTLGEIVADHELKQVRIAESEKFAHVTVFFNGGRCQPFPGQDNIQIPTRKDIAFTDNPALSLPEVTGKTIAALRSEQYALAVLNIANGDVLGHIDDRNANLACAEAVDKHLGQILNAASQAGYLS